MPHKAHVRDARGIRSKSAVAGALREARRGGGKCATTKLQRFPDFGAVVAAALLASPSYGVVRIITCPECSGFHIARGGRSC